VPAENLVTPELVRRLIWDWQPVPDASAVIDAFLTEAGARRWQRELTVPVLTEALTAPQPQQPEQAAE
jgi:ribonuclease D